MVFRSLSDRMRSIMTMYEARTSAGTVVVSFRITGQRIAHVLTGSHGESWMLKQSATITQAPAIPQLRLQCNLLNAACSRGLAVQCDQMNGATLYADNDARTAARTSVRP